MFRAVTCSTSSSFPRAARPHREGNVAAGRRQVLLALPCLTWLANQPSAQAAAAAGGGVDPADSPLIQELLRRTQEKKAERQKERLEDYYRRNYGDYFAFQAGSADAGQGGENQERIKEWLRKNAAPAFPKRSQPFPLPQE